MAHLSNFKQDALYILGILQKEINLVLSVHLVTCIRITRLVLSRISKQNIPKFSHTPHTHMKQRPHLISIAPSKSLKRMDAIWSLFRVICVGLRNLSFSPFLLINFLYVVFVLQFVCLIFICVVFFTLLLKYFFKKMSMLIGFALSFFFSLPKRRCIFTTMPRYPLT